MIGHIGDECAIGDPLKACISVVGCVLTPRDRMISQLHSVSVFLFLMAVEETGEEGESHEHEEEDGCCRTVELHDV